MTAKDPTPSQELHSREALAPVFADLNQYAATTHFVGQSTILTLSGDRATGEAYLPRTPRNRRRQQTTPDGRLAALQRHVRENGWRMAVLEAPVIRGLGGRARAVMTVTDNPKRLVIVGATGMVGGYALRYALDHPAVGGGDRDRPQADGLHAPETDRGAPSRFRGVCRAPTRSRVRTQRSFAWACIQGRFRTRNSAGSQWTIRSSSRECCAPAVPARLSLF